MSKIYEYDESVIVESNTTVPIRIVEGKYKDVVYQYGTIKFIEEDEDVRCNFTYNMIENPSDVNENQEIEETEKDFLREGNVTSEDS